MSPRRWWHHGLWRVARRRGRQNALSPLFDLGFHGDRYLLRVVDEVLQRTRAFVETGAHVGTTAKYVAENYPDVVVYSCEPDIRAYRQAQANLRDCANARVYNMESPRFLQFLHDEHPWLRTSLSLYFLDAHGGGFPWPLKEELAFVTETLTAGYVLIDDFKVPGMDHFGYDRHDGEECSFAYIHGSFNPDREYTLRLPEYTERTSGHHPLRGWILIEFGDQSRFSVSQHPQDKVRTVRLSDLAGQLPEA